jgi:hypothetical protein
MEDLVEDSDDFFEETLAQLHAATEKYNLILDIYSKSAYGSDLSMACRLLTKDFISNIKQILDQVAFRVWSYLVSDIVPKNKANQIYYPHSLSEGSLETQIGRCLEKKRIEDRTKEERDFIHWMKLVHPSNEDFSCLSIIGELSRLPHQKLISQKKTRKFYFSARCPLGGGETGYFEGEPYAFRTWTYIGRAGAIVGSGPLPIIDPIEDPKAILTVITFDPVSMSFTGPPGIKTEIQEFLECNVENMNFDAISLFHNSIISVGKVIEVSYNLGYLNSIRN